MLTERDMKAIQLYYEGRMTVQQIADECGWNSRKSVYNLLSKQEAQEYRQYIESESIKDAITMLRMNSKRMAKKLIDIADGEIKNDKTVYAELQATNSGLEKSGITAKNTVIIEDNKNNNDQDYNELLEMLEQKKEE
ncbi:hypothetical protein P9E34_19670 [Schinkia azotoformans]|uniref:terminase gpP N-terminus-related DNA-binding protein n=1 Tax=Schinkia azotoformans TaxID=1454 RepID=UPI002DBAE3CF|nr:hypothetical protein [Schinkia azotoformans]MEC1726931.1 hypothetical protein [Schinkia azotoformans]